MNDSLRLCEDGSHTIFSEKAGECYHSIHGACNESVHIFLNAGFKAVITKHENRQKGSLPKTIGERVRILEVGFGTGLNALITAIEAEKEKVAVSYIGLEPFPIQPAIAQQLNYCAMLPGNSHNIFSSMHESSWNTALKLTPFFSFQKKQIGLMEAELIANDFDLIYFDAFSPEAQPELWEQDVFDKCFRLLAPEGILVTYCAKGRVKRALKSAGFTIENLPGPAGKREITRALKLV